MLLIKDIGIWKELVNSKMSQTNFILQEQGEAFSALIQASALPAFATNLTIKNNDESLPTASVLHYAMSSFSFQ